MDMLNLKNKWVLLTGASRGIGRQVATALAQKGCRLILHSRSLRHTETLALELQRLGTDVHPIEAELSDQKQVLLLAKEAQRISGGIDILYNNAAVMIPYHEDFYALSKDEFDLNFQVNTIAPITLCNSAIPGMIQRRFGRIVNVTSGIRNQPQLMPYAASKAALDKYVFDMASSLKGTGVIMNLLDPGWLRTDLGGPHAPNPVESVLPGALVPVLLEEDTCGNIFRAQDYRR
jgi:NAD(P)-dependent dehydrogenase (short-subunit alcohol dehydrogenase family)